MINRLGTICLSIALATALPAEAKAGEVAVSGTLAVWHPITLTVTGPFAREDGEVNPFLDYRMTVVFSHREHTYVIPGYFAADGDAAETSAHEGDQWRAHFSPDRPGVWTYRVSFLEGPNVAVSPGEGKPRTPIHGVSGQINVEPAKDDAPGFLAKGRLQYIGQRYLRFAGDGSWFLKAGADSPENLLAYRDFDGTYHADGGSLKTWAPHAKDWREGDPSWQNGKGKGLIGALNYLANEGQNVFSFLTYNAGGDGKDVWPHISHEPSPEEGRVRFDVSKLDQWNIVFTHAQRLGLYLHFKTQETENDNEEVWALDGGNVGTERRLYYRELVARFGHHLALNWNLGEENTQTTEQQNAMISAFREFDAYGHPIVLHTYPEEKILKYEPLLGLRKGLTGVSVQTGWSKVHQHTLYWIQRSENTGHRWVVASDEVGPADIGVPPDPDYPDHEVGKITQADIRREVLWGNLMAGGAGVEYYFGYKLPQNDLNAQDWRSRHRMWGYNRIALRFFHDYLPFARMESADSLLIEGSGYVFADPGTIYAVYLSEDSDPPLLDLKGFPGAYRVSWYNPRQESDLLSGSVKQVQSDDLVPVSIGLPPERDGDWVALVERDNPTESE